ncbi:methyltransferase FkbM [Chthoniobacter flavus Ellin428]|uniref:Methyltransferase FkbM n=1 Tax=Chthoniobacter flavus Ellin428 TaxID=497964 RepID=B4D8N4_9BACT|nr:hypothetical protein [Chthoniobacter flavus]EDY17256.1 methyltransferase FkbM [Chthoniobacter flavus Ellin428]TCO86921.1 hypothetical protein EV701_12516 [Chthoniobacter flavus]
MAPAFDTPIAFLVFNRPDCTEKVFAEIRRAQPRKLLVVADGPRANRPDDVENVRLTREIIDRGIDWPCEVEKAYAEENMGCRNRVSSGLTWVFEHVEEAIILEDDCLPSPSFFPYCAELLARFRTDDRIMAVSGCNHGVDTPSRRYSYAFSQITHIWGWATWRRAWAHYEVDMKSWPEFRERQLIYDALSDRAVAAAWERAFESAWSRQTDTWDYQWLYAVLKRNGLTVTPHRNLIKNLGFDERATHTRDPMASGGFLELESMDFPLKHDPYFVPATRYEMEILRNLFAPSVLTRLWRKVTRIVRRLRSSWKPAAN